jgi:outer membrane protein OmpA-like peptidoglycan-associated protein
MRRESHVVSLRAFLLSATAIGLLGLSGCGSATLESLDPTGLLSRAPADSQVVGSNRAAPNLGSVPARPPAPQRADRENIARALTGDRQNAQYTDEVFRRTPEAPPPAPPAPSPVARPTTPPAVLALPSAAQSSAPQPPPASSPAASPPPPPPPPSTAPSVPAASLPSAPPPPASSPATPPAPPSAPAGIAQAPLPPPSLPAPQLPPPQLPSPQLPTPQASAPQASTALPPPILPRAEAPIAPPTLPPVMDAPQPRAAAPTDQPSSSSRAPAVIDASGAIAPTGGYAPSRSPTATPPAPAQPAGPGYVRQPLPTAPPTPPALDGRAPTAAAATSSANLDAMLRQTFPDAQAAPPAMPPRTVLPDAPAAASDATPAAVLYFQGGSVALSAEDRAILSEVAKAVRGRPGTIQIVGHASREANDTDPVRRRIVMLELSAQRAQAVARELVRLGTPNQQIEVQAMGDARPEYDDTKTTGVAGNRRVEIAIRP